MNSLTVGKIAKATGVGIETIRFYEREGLIKPPPRTSSGYRQYPETDIARILFIRNAKKLGFSLKEIRELLSIRVNPQAKCTHIKKRAEIKIVNIEEKIRTLQRMKKALVKVTRACDSNAPVGECPILESLER